MSDLSEIATQCIAAWNETDTERRRELIRQLWTETGSYVDPLGYGEGHAGIDAVIRATQTLHPGFRFRLAGHPDGYADRLRFSWTFGPERGPNVLAGTNFATLDNGRLHSVTGFLDRISAGG
jgi:hypothetical protein